MNPNNETNPELDVLVATAKTYTSYPKFRDALIAKGTIGAMTTLVKQGTYQTGEHYKGLREFYKWNVKRTRDENG